MALLSRSGTLVLGTLLWLALASPGTASFINFKPGFEYLYNLNASVHLENVNTFLSKGEIGFVNVEESTDHQELLMLVHSYTFTTADQPDLNGHNLDFSGWFSFVITRHGEILKVFHPADEDDEVLSTKKGFAGMFASKLHHRFEVDHSIHGTGWKYRVQEQGIEGNHTSVYTALPTDDGKVFTKTRHDYKHPIPTGSSRYTKTLHWKTDLETIHRVMIEEDFNMKFTDMEGYDPEYGTRRVQAVNVFTTMEYPEVQAFARDELHFLYRRPYSPDHLKPTDLHNSDISRPYKRKLKLLELQKDIDEALDFIRGNLTCMRQQPESGSTDGNLCFHHLRATMEILPDQTLNLLAQQYIVQAPPTRQGHVDKKTMIDVLGSMTRPVVQYILVNMVVRARPANPVDIKRVLTSLVNMHQKPLPVLTETLVEFCFMPEKTSFPSMSPDVHHSFLLTLGSIISQLHKHGDTDQAETILQHLHDRVGIHDPWLFRMRRAAMSEQEVEDADINTVVLLEALGNAKSPRSFEYIVSHINSTNSPWVKRAGIHALRHFDDPRTLAVLQKTAMYDGDVNVRYDAMLRYQAHPLAANSSWTGDTSVGTRDKRSISDLAFSFTLEPPGVDWQRKIGSSSIGASFGLIMQNLLALEISLLHGGMALHVYDEAYVRVHLGMFGLTYDFFDARICFKATASYSVNILNELDLDFIIELVKQFATVVKRIVGNVKKGIDAFARIINSDFSLKEMVEQFVKAFKQLPNTIAHLASKIRDAALKLAKVKMEALPPFIHSVKAAIDAATQLFERVRVDVMTFYNSIVEAIQIVIPQAAAQIFDAIKGIIDGFMSIFKDPKTSLMRIGKGIIMIWVNILQVKDTIQDIMDNTFMTGGQKPYWSDMVTEGTHVLDLFKEALKQLSDGGNEWLDEIEHDDPLQVLTKGKTTIRAVKQQIVKELREVIEDLMEPFSSIMNLGGDFFELFTDVFGVFKSIKDAYETLKQGYDFAKTIINSIFGPKSHNDFPKARRLKSNQCPKSGFFPAKLGNGQQEYEWDGLDLVIEQGEKVVAPFGGYVYQTENENEVAIKDCGELPAGAIIILSNVEPAGNIRRLSDPGYTEYAVGAGDVIGIVTRSLCPGFNHIHFAIRKGNGVLDPSRFLSGRPIDANYAIHCDDFRLVFMDKTIAAGRIVGKDGQNKSNVTEGVPEDGETGPDDLDLSARPAQEIDSIKRNTDGMYSKLRSAHTRKKRNIGEKIGAVVETLIDNIKAFLKKFSIRRIKIGAIIDFVERLKLEKTKEKMADLVKTIKEAISNKPCSNPAAMTNDELQLELFIRGQTPKGGHDQMIQQLTELDSGCPALSMKMPHNKLMYCTFDKKCLGVECCLTLEVLNMIQASYKAYVRLDPDLPALTFGFDKWNYTFNASNFFSDKEYTILMDLKMPFLEDEKFIIKYKLNYIDTALVVSLGAGLCSEDEGRYDDCLEFVYILHDAHLPLPTVGPNGKIIWQPPKIKDLFNENALEELTQQDIGASVEAAVDGFLIQLGVPKDMLGNSGSCPRPRNFELTELRERLTDRGFTVYNNETHDELAQRYISEDLECSLLGMTFRLANITQTPVGRFLYYYVSDNCLRFDVCADIEIPFANISRSFAAYGELNPCEYYIRIGFEKWNKTLILFEYDWGKEEILQVGSQVYISYLFDKDDVKKMFIVTARLVIGEFINEIVLDNHEVPIPVCNNNFSLQGNIKDLATALGGEINHDVFNLLLQQLGLDNLINNNKCTLPPQPERCPDFLNVTQLVPNFMKSVLRCGSPISCFGLTCCAEFSFPIPLSSLTMSVSFPLWFVMDPCDFSFEAGIGTFIYKQQLLHYEWGKPGSIKLGGGDTPPVLIKYILNKYEGGFIVDISADICIPVADETFCIPEKGLKLLEQSKIPACDVNAWKNISDFSLTQWLEERGQNISDQLSVAGRQALMEVLGLGGFLLEPPCDSSRKPYIPAVSGWNNLCPLSFVDLPSLPDVASCHIPDYCTAIDCCFNLDNLDLSFHVFLNINMCTYTVSGGIEKVKFNFTLFDYSWGKEESVTIKDIIKIKYSIKKPPNKKNFIIDLAVAACFEKDGSCMFENKIMSGTEVPQPGCDMSLDFKNFSLTSLLSNNGLGGVGSNSSLWDDALRFVMDVTGLDQYVLNPGCRMTADKYSTANHGWSNECPQLKNSTIKLPEFAVCHLTSSCMSVDCCLNVDFLRRTLHASLNIDFCSFTINGTIEKLQFHLNIINYNWGKTETAAILEMLKMTYKIDKTDKTFIIDLAVSVCMEKGTCQFSVDIFKNVILPVPICNLNMDFSIKNFSLTTWLDNIGHDLEKSLSTAMINTLLEQLGLDEFLLDTPCQLTDPLYTYQLTDGWTSACPKILNLPALPDDVRCHVSDYCTGIECCAFVSLIRKSVNFKFLLDTCKYKLTLGIEKVTKELVLKHDDWGKVQQFHLGGAFRIDFRIDDIEEKKMYILNVNISVCFEQTDCFVSAQLLNNAYLPKPLCNWDTAISIKDYNLQNWLNSNQITVDTSGIQDFAIEKLFEALGIAPYLQAKPCQQGTGVFMNNAKGWNTECPMSIDLPILSDSVICHVPSYCTGFQCCVHVPVVRRSFQLYFLVNACDYTLSLGIETFGLNISLMNYKWGKTETFSMLGVLKFRYSIINLEVEQQYVLSLSMFVCLEDQACELQLDLFSQTRVPKVGCMWDSHLTDFDLTQFMDNAGSRIGAALQGHLVDKLLARLGVLPYMEENQCDRTSAGFQPSAHGWKNDCPQHVTLPSLPDSFSCTLHSSCTAMDCCVDVPFISRSIHVYVHLDACTYQLHIGVEKFSLNITLLNYQWGKQEHLNVRGVFNIWYQIDNLESSQVYVVTVGLSVCFDDSKCIMDTQIVQESIFPKPLCNFDKGFALPDFSMDSWLASQGVSAGGLGGVLLSQLFEDLGLASLLLPNQCSSTSYSGLTNGWTSACSAVNTLPTLPDWLVCSLDSSCTEIMCCASVASLKRSFSLGLNLEICDYTVSAHIESLAYNYSILEIPYGKRIPLDLMGILDIGFTLKDGDTHFLLSLDTSICLDAASSCDRHTILTDMPVTKPLCKLDQSFKLPDFSLSGWLGPMGENAMSALSELTLARLVDTLGIGEFLATEQCSKHVHPYVKDRQGWNNYCPLDLSLPHLPSTLVCVIPDYCTGVDCCVQIDVLQRSVHVSVQIDACNNRLVVQIDKLKLNISLATYEWGMHT